MRAESETAKVHASGLAIAALAVSMLLSSLAVSVVSVALPALSAALAATLDGAQWIVLAYLLATTIAIVPAGYLGDVFGRKRVLLGGLLIFTAASLACASATELAALVAARAVQGIGAAAMLALTMSLVRSTVAKENVGVSMGLLGTMSAVGTALGPSFGGVLIGGFGWQAAFLALVALGLAGLALTWRFVPEDTAKTRDGRPAFDLTGLLLLGVVLTMFSLAMTAGAHAPASTQWFTFAAIAVGVLVFAVVELRAAVPAVDVRRFRDPAFSASLLMNALVSTVMMTTLVVGPFELTVGLGLDTVKAGLVMSVGPAMAMLTGVPAGRLSDRFGSQAAILAGLALMTAGVLGLAFLPAVLGVPGYVVGLVFLAPGYQMFQAANNSAVMGRAAAAQQGVTSSLLNLSRNLGLIIGASLMGSLFARAGGAAGTAAGDSAVTGSAATLTFATAGGLVMVAALIAALGSLLALRRDELD